MSGTLASSALQRARSFIRQGGRLDRRVSMLLAAAGALATLAAAPAAALAGAPCSETVSQTFTYVDGQQCYLVPTGVDELHITAVGGAGGPTSFGESIGGFGAIVSGYLAVLPGEQLYVEVGANGSLEGGADFGGGGAAGTQSGSGGGASDIRTCSIAFCTSLATEDTRLLVAGGGGGGGINEGSGGNAGYEGILDGGAGATGFDKGSSEEDPGAGGAGGTLATGGTGGAGGGGVGGKGDAGGNGTLAQGGAGTHGGGSGGGGGGGGYYGGGAGGEEGLGPVGYNDGAGGGGAGSSYASRYVLDASIATESAGEAPQVRIESSALPAGPEGAKGEEGPQGDKGSEGAQGPKGQTGQAGEQGAPGSTGASGEEGPQGAEGAQGETGAKGQAGATGAQGAAGPAGAGGAGGRRGARGFGGEDEVVSCIARGTFGHVLVQSCEVKLGGAPAKLAHGRASQDGQALAAKLRRGRKLYARGVVLERDGMHKLVLHARRRLAPGRYTLTLRQAGRRVEQMTIRIGRR
ncbi:MAG TPA: hypothetical protein VGF95_05500 [Solirubrobacteraceae bacterium]|jgi:hypothetical protein